jgi:hypothetical protein
MPDKSGSKDEEILWFDPFPFRLSQSLYDPDFHGILIIFSALPLVDAENCSLRNMTLFTGLFYSTGRFGI